MSAWLQSTYTSWGCEIMNLNIWIGGWKIFCGEDFIGQVIRNTSERAGWDTSQVKPHGLSPNDDRDDAEQFGH